MMSVITNVFAAVMVASLLACGVTSIGIYAISKYERWASEHSIYFMCFAAAVLISVSFLHIIPASFTMSPLGPASLLAGFLALHLFNRFLNLYVCDDYEHENWGVGIVPMLGIGFHSFIDGMIYSVAFNVSIFTGALAAIGMILHEFPEGIVTFVLLKRSGLSQRKAATYAFAAAAASTPLGALVSYPFINNIREPTLGALLGASAGALVYVGASHLLPAVERERQRFTIFALAAGILVAVVIVISKG